jgi:PmbA protein
MDDALVASLTAEPLADLPVASELAREIPDLDLWDDAVLGLNVAESIVRARVGEAAALKLDKRVTNSDGAVFGR